jgi:prepilin signal peptidase PulO-like enzyme (type II secretory pathway)
MKTMDSGILIAVLTGWISGWAVNYLADVLPVTRRLSAPVCGQCGQVFPLWRYLTLQPCPHCGHRRGLRPWLVHLAMLAVSLYTWIRPHPMGYALGMLLLTYFALVVVIDLEHRLILHPTSVVGALLALGIGLWLHGPIPTLFGGLAGFAIMLGLYYLGVLFSKYRARRLQAAGQQADGEEALGAGDVILAGVLGLVLGWPIIWFALLLGILLGGIVGIILLGALLLRGLYGKQALMVFMPYGPYFIVSAFFILFLPNWIIGVLGK